MAMSTAGFVPSARSFALLNLTVQRASRSFCRSLAGLAFQSSGMRPSLIARFSSSVLRCLGAATSEASTICPPIAIRPTSRSAARTARRWDASDAAAYEGVLDKTNTASAVWADTAYRSKANEDFLAKNGFVSRIHRKKPPGRPTPETTRQANALKSKVRSRVEHVFAVQKDKMNLFIRTIGIARATMKIGMANLVYNMRRLVFLDRLAAA